MPYNRYPYVKRWRSRNPTYNRDKMRYYRIMQRLCESLKTNTHSDITTAFFVTDILNQILDE